MHRRLLPEIAAWLCAALAVFCLLHWLTDTERFHLKANDCYQYLSMARNIHSGKGIATDLLHYGENQRIGQIPAPQTVFPPGYPLLMAGLEFLGVDGETAGVGVSLASFALTLALLIYLGRLLNVRTAALWCILFLMVCNGPFWSYALRIYSECLFTAVTLLALTLLIKAEYLKDNTRQRLGILAAGAFAAGFSYWVRYAGCFMVASVAFYYAVRWLRARSLASFLDTAVVGSVLATLVLPIWIRNILLVGSIQGGNPMTMNNPLPSLVWQFSFSWMQLMTGYINQTTPASLASRVNRGLLVLALVGMLLVVARQVVRHGRSIFGGQRRAALTLMATFVAFYVLGMTYVAKYTVISYDDPRMFLPIFPVVLLGLASLFPATPETVSQGRPAVRPIWIGILIATAACYCVGQGYGLCMQGSGEHIPMQAWLADTMPGECDQQTGNTSVAQWAETHLPTGEVILATDGQSCGFVLNRACLTARFPREGLAHHEAETRALADQFGVRYLFLFPDGVGTQELCEASPFFARLVAGKHPDWLRLVASTEHCRVYRVVEK